jgi:hypothetical protein
MARLFVTGINLNKNELQNARIQNLSSAPSSPVLGQVYYDTSNNTMYYYNGLTDPNGPWMPMSGSTEVITDVILEAVKGGTALTEVKDDANNTITLNLDNTTVTPGSYGSTTQIPTFTVDAQGRLTAAGTVNVATTLSVAAESGTADTVDLLTDTLTFAAGEGIDTTVTNNTITIAGEDASTTNKGVASFNSDDFNVTTGHVELEDTVVKTVTTDSGALTPSSHGLSILGGEGIDVTHTGTSITVAGEDASDTNKGVASFNSTAFSVTNGHVNLVAFANSIDANGNKITELADPTADTDAANKRYVDAVAQGLHIHEAAHAATTANLAATYDNGTAGVGATLTLSSSLTVLDGHTLNAGDRILVKNQTNAFENGIYVYTSDTVLTRAADFNQAIEIHGGDFVFVENGTLYNSTGWVNENEVNTVGTDVVLWLQFSGVGTFTAGAGLTLSGTEFSVDVTPSSGNASLTNTGGAVEVKVNTNDGLEVTGSGLGINNGAGFTFSSGSLVFDTANGYGTRKLAFNVGDNSATSFTVNHGIGTRDVTVQVFDNASPYAQVETDVEHTDSNNVTIKFALAPTTDQYRVVVVG